MKPFRQKKNLTIEEICTRYYEYEVLSNPDYSNMDFQIFSRETENDAVCIDREAFTDEIIALRLELFGLALSKVELLFKETWTQATFDSAIDTVSREAKFSKSYLTVAGKSNIWNTMGSYNETIAGIKYEEGLLTLGAWHVNFPGLLDSGSRGSGSLLKTSLKYKNLAFSDAFKEVILDNELYSRVVNRLYIGGGEYEYQIFQALTIKLAERLGCLTILHLADILSLELIVDSLYKNAETFIRKCKDWDKFIIKLDI